MNVTAFAVYSNSLAIYSYKIPTCFESYIVVTSLYKHVTCIIHLKPIYRILLDLGFIHVHLAVFRKGCLE